MMCLVLTVMSITCSCVCVVVQVAMSLLHDCLPCVCVLWRLHVRCFHVCLSSAFYMSMSLVSEDVGVSDHYALLSAVSVLCFLRRNDLYL